MSTLYERVGRAIDRYEKEFVNPTVSDIRVSFAIQIVYHIALLIFGILTNLNPSLTSVIGTLGLGSLGIGANWQRLQKTVEKFQKDRRALKLSVTELRARYDLCAKNDERCLKDVIALLIRYLQEAKKASS